MKRRYALTSTREIASPNPENSPRIVALGGGHGLHNLLRGLKNYTKNLTAIVTVSDDGGSSGMLRRELSIPAPGDIRNCMQALSNAEPLMRELLEYRFSDGSLRGQSFGNLLLAALNGIAGSFDEAVSMMQQVLAITGQVLPVTVDNIQLQATFDNGSRVLGESKISAAKIEQGCRIQSISIQPPNPQPLGAALSAIAEADLILMGPGSLYTSLIPHLLIPGIADAIRKTEVPRIYLTNLMTEAGETEGYTVTDHLRALYAHGGEGLFTACLHNCASIPEALRNDASAQSIAPVEVDEASLNAMGVELLTYPLISPYADHICHSPSLLAQAIREFYESRTIKVFPSRAAPRYILERE